MRTISKISSVLILLFKFFIVIILTYFTLNNESYAHFIVDLLLPICIKITSKKDILIVIFNIIPFIIYAIIVESIYRIIKKGITKKRYIN